MITRVVNARSLDRLIPIRRNLSVQHQWVDRTTQWGNPFSLSDYGGTDYDKRVLAVIEYRQWLGKDRRLMGQVKRLAGHSLVCWCAPKLCHAYVLAAFADGNRLPEDYSMVDVLRELGYGLIGVA